MARKKDYRELLVTPYETTIQGFTSIAKYFQYYAPCIDSAQSPGEIENGIADIILEKMVEDAGLGDKTIFLKRNQQSSWEKHGLDGFELDFEIPFIFCVNYSKETQLHGLLRHIRNSLAHGYLYVWKKRAGSYILFVDKSENNKNTAKIMVSMKILEKWKSVLEEYSQYAVREQEKLTNK